MKTHTSGFKNQIKELGRQLNCKVSYSLNEINQTLYKEDLNGVTCVVNGNILKSTMKELNIDSNIDIPIGTILKCEFGIKVNEEYEYLNFGNYIVYSSVKNEDTNSYCITCYDKMLYSMKQNEDLNVTYPITINDYINALCNKLGLTFANNNQNFANCDKTINQELYVGLDYTYRDILDELAQVTASTICINGNDELEIRYINTTNDIVDEEFLNDINVQFEKKYGPINSVVLSRSAESDNVFLRNDDSIEANGLCEVKIVDNQIMNWNDRDEYLPDILEKLNGLEYYINDFSSKGICYYDLCDKYSVKIGENTYNCILFNTEINITQGLEENIYTEMPKETQTDYSKADKTDRKINQTFFIVDKELQEINGRVSSIEEQNEINTEKITDLQITSDGINTKITKTQEDVSLVKNELEEQKTATEAKIQIINEQIIDGVPKVTTTTGTFDENGIHLEKTGSPTALNQDESGTEVIDKTGEEEKTLAYMGYTTAEMVAKNLELAKYLGQTVSFMQSLIVNGWIEFFRNYRLQETTDDTHGKGIGLFYVGDEN